VPGEDIGSVVDAGQINLVLGSATGLDTVNAARPPTSRMAGRTAGSVPTPAGGTAERWDYQSGNPYEWWW
jgi:hypothetical protein